MEVQYLSATQSQSIVTTALVRHFGSKTANVNANCFVWSVTQPEFMYALSVFPPATSRLVTLNVPLGTHCPLEEQQVRTRLVQFTIRRIEDVASGKPDVLVSLRRSLKNQLFLRMYSPESTPDLTPEELMLSSLTGYVVQKPEALPKSMMQADFAGLEMRVAATIAN